MKNMCLQCVAIIAGFVCATRAALDYFGSRTDKKTKTKDCDIKNDEICDNE